MTWPKPLIVASDNHGDMQDDATVDALHAFVSDFKPVVRVHAGDNWDFRNFRKGASDEEKKASLEEDWKKGSKFFRKFFSGGLENYFLRGNHDERLWMLSNNGLGAVQDYAKAGVKRVEQLCRRAKVKMLPYDSALGVLQLGHLAIVHGYHAGTGAARQHAAVYGNCIFGHVHTQESAPVPSLKPAEAKSIGCLCIRDMEYINTKTGKLRWAQGWAYGYLFEDGSYQLFLTRKINGKFYAATEIRTY